MSSTALLDQLLALPSAEQRHFLCVHLARLPNDAAEQLKERVIQSIRSDIHYALDVARLILILAELTHDPLDRAIGLRAEAQARSIGLGEHEQALPLYEEAMQLCEAHGDEVGHARIQVTRVYPLANLGRYEEAFAAGRRAAQVLEAHAQWRSLATLTMNLALIHGRLGRDAQALEMLDKARHAYRQLGPDGEPFLAQAEHNRAVVLRNLGQFDKALEAAQTALAMHQQLGHAAEAARTHQNLALTYFVLGRYNDALEWLSYARDFFLEDGRARDAVLTELFMSNCLLQLRRFSDVLEKCQHARTLFAERGTRFEVGQALLNEAIAFAGLGHHDEAMVALAAARQTFEAEGNEVWVASVDLETAALLYRRGDWQRSFETAQHCIVTYEEHALPIEEAQASLVAARAAAALQRISEAEALVAHALVVGEERQVTSLLYQCHSLLGRLAISYSNLDTALTEYDHAIETLERLRGQLMVEYRVGFLEDKEEVYAEAVDLCLKLEQPEKGLDYAERAKSRVLLDLLAYRLDIGIHARREADRPLVAELTRLRAERDRLYRRWAGDEELHVRGWLSTNESRQQVQQEVLAIEKQITHLWHTLLIHNADYAQDAALWQVRTERAQPYLDANTVLLEFFTVRQQFVAFIVTAETLHAVRLPTQISQIQYLLRLLRLNVAMVPRSAPADRPALATNAQGLFKRLHSYLLEPLLPLLPDKTRLVIVPHGPLHYLPFHALYDGREYLLEQRDVSYLPSASFLRYCREVPEGSTGLLAVGHSYEGRLPFTVREAETVASLWGGTLLIETEATCERLREEVADYKVLHLATHGEFRADNPLFSGLALTDGWLTTLDIFNLHLRASLVTLSACQTGRSVVGGGDELLGLIRAFLSAGAASLVATLWMVEDESTSLIMAAFYSYLAAGQTKSLALQAAQQQLLESGPTHYAHPYFWAPFFLVGHAGTLG